MTDQMPDISKTELTKAREILNANAVINHIANNTKDVDRETVIDSYKNQYAAAKERSNELKTAEIGDLGAVFLVGSMAIGIGADLSLKTYNRQMEEFESNKELYTELPEPTQIGIKKPSETAMGIMTGGLTGIFLLASVAFVAYGQKMKRTANENIKNDIAQFKNGPKAP